MLQQGHTKMTDFMRSAESMETETEGAYVSAQGSLYPSSSASSDYASNSSQSSLPLGSRTNDFAHIPMPPVPDTYRRQTSDDEGGLVSSDSAVSMFTATSKPQSSTSGAHRSRKTPTKWHSAASASASSVSSGLSEQSHAIVPITSNKHGDDKENGGAAMRRPVRRVRMPAKASLPGFPFRSSVVALGPSSNKNRMSTSTGSGSKSSDEINLDLSFEAYDMPMTADGTNKDWIGIDMPNDRGHDVPEGELVRSPSGRLIGTNRRRSRSMAEGGLRAAYLADERILRAVPPQMMPSSSSRTVKQSSSGFSFNTTHPVTVPDDLHIPIKYWHGDEEQRHKSSGFPLPLRLLERRSLSMSASPVSSPAWSITSFFTGSTFSRKGKQTDSTMTEDDRSPRSEQAPWADAVTQATMAYMRARPEGLPRSPLSQSGPLSSQATPREAKSTRSTIRTTPHASTSFDGSAGTPKSGTMRQRRRTGQGLGIGMPGESMIPSVSISLAADSRPSIDESVGSSESETRGSPSRRLSREDRLSRDRLEELLNRSQSASGSSSSATPHAQDSSERFTFKPAPLKLVESHWGEQPSTMRKAGRTSLDGQPVPVPLSEQQGETKRRARPARLMTRMLRSPRTQLDLVVPAKLLFITGFLFGPWMWLIGGWCLRKDDGEFFGTTTTTKRCRDNACSCGTVCSTRTGGYRRRDDDDDYRPPRAHQVGGTPVGMAERVSTWQHDKNQDLFLPSSSIDKPAIAFGRPPPGHDNSRRSASPPPRAPRSQPADYPPAVKHNLRPAESTSYYAQQQRGTSNGHGHGRQPNDLGTRLEIIGSTDRAADEARQRTTEREQRLQQQRAAEERARREEQDRIDREQYKIRKALAEREKDVFVVVVDGLVFGTSADDVQTAFSAYGETAGCTIVNEQNARESDSLVARLCFTKAKDADYACSKLNGAVADGKTLKVYRVASTPMPALPASIIEKTRQSNMRADILESSKSQVERLPTSFDAEEEQNGGMDVDQDDAYYGRGSQQATPATNGRNDESGRRGGRRGRGGGGGRAGGRGGKADGQGAAAREQPVKATSLIDRLGPSSVSLLDRIGGDVPKKRK